MFNSVNFNHISKDTIFKTNIFEEITSGFGIPRKVTIPPITPEEASFEQKAKNDEAKIPHIRYAPKSPSGPHHAIQLIYKPKDKDDLQKKTQAREDFRAYKAEKMACGIKSTTIKTIICSAMLCYLALTARGF